MTKYIVKPDPEVALRMLKHTGIRQLGYDNDKEFCLEAIKNKHPIYVDLSYKLRNDKEILKATIDNAFNMDFIGHIPKRLQNQEVLDLLIDSNLSFEYEDLGHVIHQFGLLSKRESNIIRAINRTKSPLKTPYVKYTSSSYASSSNHYPLVKNNSGNKVSLFSKFFVVLSNENRLMFDRQDAIDFMQNIKFKKIALSLSPEAAFEFLMNNELSQKEFAEIFANHFIKYTSRGYFYGRHWIKCDCGACTGLNWKKFAPSDPEKEFRLKKIVIDHILMKTKSLHKICVFLHFNEAFHIPRIIDRLKSKLNIKNKKTSLLMNIKNTYHYGEMIVGDEIWERDILKNPILIAEEFLQNTINDGFDKIHFIRENKALYLQDVNKEVFIDKAFIKGILPCFKKVWFDSDNVSKKDIWLSQTAAKYINKFKDLSVLKQIIYFQSEEPRKHENIMKYIHKDIKKEVIEYYLIQNYTLLPYSYIKSPNAIFNETYIKKIESKFLIKRDISFYTKLVNAYGVKAFKNNDKCYIPEEFKDNKDFMINAVLKSYKTLRHASDKIKADPDVVKIAFLKSRHSFKSASQALKKDKLFLDSLFKDPVSKFRKAHHTIKTDKDICVPAINSNINLVKDLSSRMIKKLNMDWFSDIQREKIFEEYVKRCGTHDVFLIAAKKRKFLSL